MEYVWPKKINVWVNKWMFDKKPKRFRVWNFIFDFKNNQLILNFRDFAIVRAKNSNCNIILSSATPSIETFLNVKTKKFEIVKLKKRINKNVLPTIKILDSRKQKGLISDKLQQAIKSNISNNLQTLLFLNKRGYAPFVICKKCGVTKTCNNCSSSLTLHEFAEKKKVIFFAIIVTIKNTLKIRVKVVIIKIL